jgi:ABC-type nitrate/sulfonate/bicarbonate transport system substrate-binding protein
MLSHKKYNLILPLVLALSLLLGACQGGGQSAQTDEVTVQLSWFHSAEFAGFYLADQLGYYEEENIAVNLVAGGPETDPVSEIATGEAQFGIVAGDGVIRAQGNGQDLVALAAIYRKSPLVVMSLADSGIQKPEDLQGKTVGVISPGLDTTWDIQFIAMLNTLGIDPNSMTFVPNEFYHGADDLLSGKMEASSGNFSINEPVQATMDGHDLNLIYYSDYSIEFYNNLIVTDSNLIAENPDLVERFMRATLKGYQHAIEHPEEAANQTVKYDENLDFAFQKAMMEAQIPLIDTGDAPVGSMDKAVWENTQQILLNQNVIDSSVNVANFYTNEFIEGTQ